MAASEIGKLTEAVAMLRQALAALGLDERGEVVDPVPDDAGTSARRLVAARVLLSLAFSQHELGRDLRPPSRRWRTPSDWPRTPAHRRCGS